MPLTPISGNSSYCTAAQFLQRYDWRTVGDYLSDQNQRITRPDQINNTILADLLSEASGEFEIRLMRGGRYAPGDIQSLQGNALQLVAGIVAGWTMFLIWSRRPGRFADHRLPLGAELALQKMEQLGTGELILPFQETADAGRISHYVENAQDVANRNGIIVQSRRLVGQRGDMNDVPPLDLGSGLFNP